MRFGRRRSTRAFVSVARVARGIQTVVGVWTPNLLDEGGSSLQYDARNNLTGERDAVVAKAPKAVPGGGGASYPMGNAAARAVFPVTFTGLSDQALYVAQGRPPVAGRPPRTHRAARRPGMGAAAGAARGDRDRSRAARAPVVGEVAPRIYSPLRSLVRPRVHNALLVVCLAIFHQRRGGGKGRKKREEREGEIQIEIVHVQNFDFLMVKSRSNRFVRASIFPARRWGQEWARIHRNSPCQKIEKSSSSKLRCLVPGWKSTFRYKDQWLQNSFLRTAKKINQSIWHTVQVTVQYRRCPTVPKNLPFTRYPTIFATFCFLAEVRCPK